MRWKRRSGLILLMNSSSIAGLACSVDTCRITDTAPLAEGKPALESWIVDAIRMRSPAASDEDPPSQLVQESLRPCRRHE